MTPEQERKKELGSAMNNKWFKRSGQKYSFSDQIDVKGTTNNIQRICKH